MKLVGGTNLGTFIHFEAVHTILIPSVFLMNTSDNKDRIIEFGWKDALKTFIGVSKNSVEPHSSQSSTDNRNNSQNEDSKRKVILQIHTSNNTSLNNTSQSTKAKSSSISSDSNQDGISSGIVSTSMNTATNNALDKAATGNPRLNFKKPEQKIETLNVLNLNTPMEE